MNREDPVDTKRKVELLAPAGTLEIGIAAVNHGADAVYIGAPRFGARSAAANSIQDIEKLASYAHRFYSRVYVALNTLLEDDELDLAVNLVRQCYDAGADGLIIQDMGLLECELPPIPLHASTQCDNRSLEKVHFLEKVGFQQVVLARELSIEQIRTICRNTEVVIECFVHGALCVSYSGQCYISEAVAGRSANRGECAQFCRHRYTLKDRRGKVLTSNRHLLSLRDLDLSGHIGALLEAGVSSFKIEGRLKDISYVKNVTAAYRRTLDTLIAANSTYGRTSSGTCRFDFEPDTARSFNRGKTSYFLVEDHHNIAEIRTPKSLGQYIGTVVLVKEREFVVETDEILSNGDGLCFFDQKGELQGLKVNRAEGKRVYTHASAAVRPGTELYRNYDSVFIKLLENSRECRKIRVDLEITESENLLNFAIADEDGSHSIFQQKIGPEKARYPEKTREMISRQAQKTGETIFTVASCEIRGREGYFISAAEFNQIRRQAFEEHEKKRRAKWRQPVVTLVPNDAAWLSSGVDWRDNITNYRAEEFYRRHGVRKFSKEKSKNPRKLGNELMTTKYCLRKQSGLCPHEGEAKMSAAEPLLLTDNTGTYELQFHCGRCEMSVRMMNEHP